MKYVSGRIKELKVGISSYSEDKTPFSVVGNMDVIGIISATTVSISTTTDVASEFVNINVAGISTFNGEIDSNGRIVGAATSNVIPFLYSNYSDLPSAEHIMVHSLMFTLHKEHILHMVVLGIN